MVKNHAVTVECIWCVKFRLGNMKERIREEYELWEWEKFSEFVHG